MKISQTISPEKKEQIILLYLEGVPKYEIIERVQTTWWHLNCAIYKFETRINSRSYLTENLELIKKEEKSLIELAYQMADGKVTNEKEYHVRLNAFVTADVNNYCVFI